VTVTKTRHSGLTINSVSLVHL